jgi:Anti-sigma-28 factor, FlgM
VTTPSSDRASWSMLTHMTVMALRYDTRPGRFRSGWGGAIGFVRDARAARRRHTMDESRTIKMQALRERLEADQYEIDPHKVADAIVERLLARRDGDGDRA